MRKLLSLSVFCILINMHVFAQGTATVSGRVTIGSQPAAGVEVLLTSSDPAVLNSNPPPPISATTDADGRYKLSSVPAGSYRITAYAPAWVAKTEGNENWLGRILSVSEGENIEKIDFTLTRGAVITGRVSDSSGRGLIEENVLIIPVDAEGKRINAPSNRASFGRTDDRGEYRVFGLAAGRYRVGAGPEPGDARGGIMSGGRYQRTWHPDTTDEPSAKIVVVEAGEEADKIDIAMAAAEKREVYSVAGRVIDAATGAPVSGAMIAHMQMKGDQPQSAAMNSTATNSGGEFRIDSIAPGSYQAMAFLMEGGDAYSEPVRFEIDGGDVAGLEIRMRSGGSISGTVVVEGGAPPEVMALLTKVEIMARPISAAPIPFFGGRGNVKSDGSFRLGGLPPGKLALVYSNFIAPKGLSLLRIEHNGVIGREIELKAGENVTGVRFVLQYGSGVVDGRVEVRNGTIPPGTRLFVGATRAGAPGPTAYRADVDNRGRFVIEGFSPGNYQFRLDAWITLPDGRTVGVSSEQEVIITSGGRQQVTLVLDLSKIGKEDE